MRSTIDTGDWLQMVEELVREIARHQKRMCGKVTKMAKKADGVAGTSIHMALSHMDMLTQDYLMIPILQRWPHLVPLVEEDTAVRRAFRDNTGDDILIIDPIDGTEIYCEGGKDYSIMVGLIQNGKPAAGIGWYPETGEYYVAQQGTGAWRVGPGQSRSRVQITYQPGASNRNVAVHYRFLDEPYGKIAARIHEAGVVTPTNKVDFGTNLSGILRVLRGESCAFLGPHITLHDFVVPALLVAEAGGTVKLVHYKGKDDVSSWADFGPFEFHDLSAAHETPRARVIIADSDTTAETLAHALRVASAKKG